MVKYSIILPVHNGGDYIKECVQSILNQTYKEFDLVILENMSTDDTSEWVASLNNNRIKVYPSEKKLNIEENWGRIKSIEKGEYITLIGHDDILDENYLSTMDKLITENPEAGLYQAHFRYIDSNGGKIRDCKPMPSKISGPEFLADFLNNRIDVMGTGFMMRSSDYDRAGGIPPYPGLLFADFELWIKLIGHKYLAVAKEQIFAFRLHKSATTNSKDVVFYNAYVRFIKFIVNLKSDKSFNAVIENNSSVFLKFYGRGLAHRLLRTPKAQRKGHRVRRIIADTAKFQGMLSPGNASLSESSKFLRFEKMIDENFIVRNLFLFFKKIYKNPVIKNK